jgi:hypothetical protein
MSTVINDVRITGPTEVLNRLQAAIEASATDRGEGHSCFKQFEIDRDRWAAEMPEWERSTDLGILESRFGDTQVRNAEKHCRYSERDDGRPVRIVNNALLIKSVTTSTPPVDFIERLGELFPEVEAYVVSVELFNGMLDIWRSRAGRSVLVEHQMSIWTQDGIYEWEKQDKLWQWTGERTADIEMLAEFLLADMQEDEDDVPEEEVRSACRLAYDAVAFPETILPKEANGYAFSVASTIAKYRCALARTARLRAESKANAQANASSAVAPWDESAGDDVGRD